MVRMGSSARPVEFRIYAPEARRVSLVGDFNKWNTKTLTARRDMKGNWLVRTNLRPGRYEYKFYVDGNWMDDPYCNWRVTNTFGSQNCVIDIK